MTENLTGWRTSTRSAQQGACVEVGGAPGLAGVRDTKDRNGDTLVFNRAVWEHFLMGVKAERFDAPQS
ncbi:DUF397 domain-containing protein [Saccharopolyspora erythraea]|uniref:DUF397 domain-containing protein n=1 Tax=Saccharopolyspora erythraea TaxID=1836 RepID=UPI00038CF2BD|nr:DUF397 domain-containing protein [Saccharopolyspora erythraea]EQD86097.1 hypothetical protein N599_11240 [Saccharopolyspora erythraea D]QRK90808.1 DUF397 domain-containing protein [Saccharopolyspora erythraea]